ncbi:MAG: carbon-nitrogen family hydrolase [Saprospiraceae bacterium]|nr:carbon-nitrogen family hydrolase [Saprospiraceae bacterium]
MKIAVVQMDCIPGDVTANLDKIRGWIYQSAPVDLIVFPEMVDTGYVMPGEDFGRSHPAFEEKVDIIARAARERKMQVIAGLSEQLDDQVCNVAVLVDKSGDLMAKYRKIHLYAPSGEGAFSAGNELTTFPTGGYTAGLMICYDTRFPEMARSLALAGAEIIIVPTAWPFPRVEHWQLLSRARAIENQCYVITANRVGKDGDAVFCGNSRVIDPHGVVISSASEDREEIIYSDISREKLDFIRNRMPVFEHRRPDIYLQDALFASEKD